MTFEEAEQLSLKSRWKTSLCAGGESCWCGCIEPEEPIEFDFNGVPHLFNIIGDGSVSKSFAEYIVKLHNDSLPQDIFDNKIDEWHALAISSKEPRKSLHEYLGLTKEEYEIWLTNPEVIERKFR